MSTITRSTTLTSHIVATALVVTMLVLGGFFGHAFLGGNTSAPADAIEPSPTPAPTACLICGGGSGGVGGNIADPSTVMTTNSGGVGVN